MHACFVSAGLTAPCLNCTMSRVRSGHVGWSDGAPRYFLFDFSENGPSMSRNQQIGKWGEEAAADYLAAHGYEVIGSNLRTPYGEIDVLARRDQQVIFVEVKARTSRSFGPPEISVGPQKRAHMIACAEHYAQQNRIDHWRIDVIAIERAGRRTEITHFENAVS